MKDMGIRQGSSTQAVQLTVGKDTVYVRNDITPILEDIEGNPVQDLFSYHEIQYDKDEYIALLNEQLDKLAEADLNNKMALTEIFEMIIV